MTRDADLPQANRPTATAPGHWVLARIGKRVLRPGGLGLTRALLQQCGVTGLDVVELAPGLGRTAKEIIQASPRSYTGVDLDADAARQVSKIVAGRGTCRQGDASDTGLETGSADVVIAEAMLTMQSPRRKSAIVTEAARLLRPGGRYAIHELALGPGEIDEETVQEVSGDLARTIHVNARPLTVAGWQELLQQQGLVVDWCQTAPFALLQLRRNLADEGLGSVARMAWRLLTQPDLRQRALQMRRVFTKYQHQLCGVAVVARKADSQEEE